MKTIVIGVGSKIGIIAKHINLAQCDVVVLHPEHLIHVEPETSILPNIGSKYHK